MIANIKCNAEAPSYEARCVLVAPRRGNSGGLSRTAVHRSCVPYHVGARCRPHPGTKLPLVPSSRRRRCCTSRVCLFVSERRTGRRPADSGVPWPIKVRRHVGGGAIILWSNEPGALVHEALTSQTTPGNNTAARRVVVY